MTSAEAHEAQAPIDPASDAIHDDAEKRPLGSDINDLLLTVSSDRVGNMSFAIDDIPYHVIHQKNANGASRVIIQAVLGYLPFSIDAKEKRQAIMLILSASHTLGTVRFGLDPHGRIFAAGSFTAKHLTGPAFIFYPLHLFLQEATPFIKLIGQYF